MEIHSILQSLTNSPTYSGMKMEGMDSMEMEIDNKEFVKTETQQILAQGINIVRHISKNYFPRVYQVSSVAVDLHCSSEDDEADDDMMEEVKGEFDDMSAIDYNQTQVAAAEAMMQLGNFAYYSAGEKNCEYPGRGFVVFIAKAENLFMRKSVRRVS